jgi:hypothetical protein
MNACFGGSIMGILADGMSIFKRRRENIPEKIE